MAHYWTRIGGFIRSSKSVICLTRLTAPLHQRSSRFFSTNSRLWTQFEPDGLDDGPEIPEYPTVNISMKGYDFPVLENYARYVHSIFRNWGLQTASWAVPATTEQINVFKERSSNTLHSYDLSLFERTVQVDNLPSTLAPILLDVMQQHLPEGVSFTVKEPDPEEEEFRYVPNIERLKLEAEIDELNQAREDRKRK